MAAKTSGVRPKNGAASVDSVDVPSLKVVIVGDYGVGKTSLIRMLTQRQFLANSGTTIGVEFKEHRFPNAVLQIWDIAGQQYMSSMTKQYYRWASAAIVCVDVTKQSTFEVALDWRRDVLEKSGCNAVATATSGAFAQQNGGSPSKTNVAAVPQPEEDVPSMPVFLFANKADLLSQSSHTKESLQRYGLENGFTDVVLTCAKEFPSVQQAFQHVATFVVDSQDSQTLDGTQQGSTGVNLNALRRSVRPGEGQKREKKECCK